LVRTLRYPLKPTKAQEATLLRWLGQCCDLYNAALQERRDAWKKQRRSVSLYDQQKSLTEWRHEDEDARAVPVKVQQTALARVDRAFKAFFRRCKAGQTPGFPRFRARRRYDSFTVPGDRVSIDRDRSRVNLPKLPGVKLHMYRPLRGRVLTATVRREAGGKWSISLACDIGAAPPLVETRSVVGVDVGLRSLAVTSDGEVVENPRHAERAAAKLARAQRVLARRKRGSRSRERARVAVARCHARVKNQRVDHARKVAVSLVSRYDVVAHEDLQIRAMSRGLFAKSIHDAGWGVLLHCIACKAESAGKHVVAVDPRGTSQRCSGCAATVPKDLRERVHDCAACGLRLDRDHNAALNIMALGRSAVADAWQKRQAEAQSGA
jgi:putative transposase